jgi:hypothetical protein
MPHTSARLRGIIKMKNAGMPAEKKAKDELIEKKTEEGRLF